MFKTIFGAAALSLCAFAASAATFADRASFNAAVAGVTNHVSPAVGFTTAPISFGGMTFTRGSGASNFGFSDSFSSLLTNELAISGSESFNIDFATPVFGFAMDVHEPTAGGSGLDRCGTASCTESTFSLGFFTGGAQVATLSFAPANNTLAFLGFTLAGGFDRITVLDANGNADNEYFGNFSTASALADVPVPAAGLLLLGGVAMLGALRRRG